MSESKESTEKLDSDKKPADKISRRDFLKYGVGVTAVAVGATALMGKIPLPADQPKTPRPANYSSEPIVVTVEGDHVTVMTGHSEVKLKDPGLAGEIASKIQ